jgi:hypothetical protein
MATSLQAAPAFACAGPTTTHPLRPFALQGCGSSVVKATASASSICVRRSVSIWLPASAASAGGRDNAAAFVIGLDARGAAFCPADRFAELEATTGAGNATVTDRWGDCPRSRSTNAATATPTAKTTAGKNRNSIDQPRRCPNGEERRRAGANRLGKRSTRKVVCRSTTCSNCVRPSARTHRSERLYSTVSPSSAGLKLPSAGKAPSATGRLWWATGRPGGRIPSDSLMRLSRCNASMPLCNGRSGTRAYSITEVMVNTLVTMITLRSWTNPKVCRRPDSPLLGWARTPGEGGLKNGRFSSLPSFVKYGGDRVAAQHQRSNQWTISVVAAEHQFSLHGHCVFQADLSQMLGCFGHCTFRRNARSYGL